MDRGLSPARQARSYHRHELHTVTYVTLDQANGGIVRNLTHDGIGVQAVVAVRPRQHVRVRFELRYPRLRVETRGEVIWSTFSGQCGIRFLDLSARLRRQIDEWIFGNLLEHASLQPQPAESIFSPGRRSGRDGSSCAAEEEDGLLISPAPLKVIALPLAPPAAAGSDEAATSVPLDWLSQPLSAQSLAWTVNTLVVFAGVLLCAVIFLSVTREPPRWPFAMGAAAVASVSALYWGFFWMFGGISLGTRLARLVSGKEEDAGFEDGIRFR